LRRLGSIGSKGVDGPVHGASIMRAARGWVPARRRGPGASLRLASLALAVALLGGCVSVELPSIAHVHVGHVITAWPDTPGNRGLLELTLADAAVAAEHAAYAVEGAGDLRAVRLHLGHVLHVVDPVLEPIGPGSGYGLLRALKGAAEHLEYAAEVPDASANLRGGARTVAAGLRPLLGEVQAIAALAEEGRRSPDAGHALAFAHEVRERAERLAGQLQQQRQRLTSVLQAEDPPYRTVPRRFLFGIIRLPSGQWVFDKAADATRPAPYGQ
jgi:hypothetical protein